LERAEDHDRRLLRDRLGDLPHAAQVSHEVGEGLVVPLLSPLGPLLLVHVASLREVPAVTSARPAARLQRSPGSCSSRRQMLSRRPTPTSRMGAFSGPKKELAGTPVTPSTIDRSVRGKPSRSSPPVLPKWPAT